LGPGQVTGAENAAIVDATEDDPPLVVPLLLDDFPLVPELLLLLELQPAIPMASAERPIITHWARCRRLTVSMTPPSFDLLTAGTEAPRLAICTHHGRSMGASLTEEQDTNRRPCATVDLQGQRDHQPARWHIREVTQPLDN
jgi:hypothetical protein